LILNVFSRDPENRFAAFFEGRVGGADFRDPGRDGGVGSRDPRDPARVSGVPAVNPQQFSNQFMSYGR